MKILVRFRIIVLVIVLLAIIALVVLFLPLLLLILLFGVFRFASVVILVSGIVEGAESTEPQLLASKLRARTAGTTALT